jgi:1-acyl-sn-glycerol-3-phosphate acyltransferase
MLPALRSIAIYVFVALYVLFLGPPFLLIALLLGNPAPLYRVAHLGVWFGLRLSGIKMVVEGAEHIQRQRAAV